MTPAAGGNRTPSPHPETPRTARPGPMLHRVRDRDTHLRLRRSRRVRRGPLTVSSVAVAETSPGRVAFAVGRNVGSAVCRNRARRRLRAVMADLAPSLEGRAWLIGAGPEVLDTDFDRLRESAASAVAHLAGR